MLDVSIVDEAVDLLEHGRDCVLLRNMGSIAVLTAVVGHELHTSLHASEVCCELDDILVLLQALGLQIPLVDVEVQDDLEEGLERCLGAVNTLESVEAQRRDAVDVEGLKLLGDLVQLELEELESFLQHF